MGTDFQGGIADDEKYGVLVLCGAVVSGRLGVGLCAPEAVVCGKIALCAPGVVVSGRLGAGLCAPGAVVSGRLGAGLCAPGAVVSGQTRRWSLCPRSCGQRPD